MALTQVSRGLLSTSIVDNGNATAITIDSSENVGIGTSSPSDALHVLDSSGNAYASIARGTQSQGEVGLRLRGGTSGNDWYVYQKTSSNNLNFYNTADRVTIDSSGNVGIGTSSPANSLEIQHSTVGTGNGSNNTLALRYNSTTLYGQHYMDANGLYHIRADAQGVSGGNLVLGADNTVQIWSGSTPEERLRIDSSGNLLVGTTSSHGKLAIGDFSATGADYGIAFVDGGDIYFVRSSTNISTNNAHYQFYNTNGKVGSITTSGSATAFNTSSDQRLKENIQDADDAGSKIDAIQVRKFDWIADGAHQDYGMVAQELVTVAPEAVSVPEDPNEMMGIDYSKLVPMLVKEIQSLRARVQQLEN